jgi:outer membrane protein TolC
VPLGQGGRRRGRVLGAGGARRSRRGDAEVLRPARSGAGRRAFLDLDATARQLALAGKTRDLANQQLTQARDRFAAGVASNVEVVQAQDALATATEQFIGAQYGYDLAKGALVRGTGTSEELLRQLLGGPR